MTDNQLVTRAASLPRIRDCFLSRTGLCAEITWRQSLSPCQSLSSRGSNVQIDDSTPGTTATDVGRSPYCWRTFVCRYYVLHAAAWVQHGSKF